jgi:hypothetical protein
MYAPHFAAALAIKSDARRAPLWALLFGCFLPDLLWIAFARAGIEPASPTRFYDDWSHSFLSILLLSSLFSALFWKYGRTVMAATWLAAFSHFLLDFPVHPKLLALYPRSRIHLGWDLLVWGSRASWFGVINDWWLQLVVLLMLLLYYSYRMLRNGSAVRLILAPCVLLIGLHLLTLFACISY